MTLKYVKPPIWRRIVVPGGYSFWDLHVAIQDAMGWLDGRLHVFRGRSSGTGAIHEIGDPDLDDFREAMLTERKVAISDLLHARAAQVTYPLCLKGARAYLPEDCGGIGGYSDLLRTLHGFDPKALAEVREWLGRDYDSAAFDPREVCFDDPKERLRTKIS